MKRLSLIFLVSLMFFVASNEMTSALEDPRKTDNNKVGIHITNTSEIDGASDLVNSQGGEWGYVTLVIRDNEMNTDDWQDFFDKLRDKKLIPIVRLATHAEGEMWTKPTTESVDEWVDFLSSLNWVVKNRYILLFNEPNHAKEWGGEIDPAGYVEMVNLFHKKLKDSSDDYFILPAGMDDAASDTSITMNSARYFKEMYQADDNIFKKFDGWTSHSYPNPGFSGKVTDTGPGTVRGFEAELRLVKQFGFDDTKPVFITETGWVHSDGVEYNPNYLSPEKVAENLVYSFENVWNADNVVAVTPFILNYPSPPFDHFSWKKAGDDEFLPQYEAIKKMEKVTGKPKQGNESEYIKNYLPDVLAGGGSYKFLVEFKNTGQSIWTDDDFGVELSTNMPGAVAVADKIKATKPGETASIFVNLTTPEVSGEYFLDFELKSEGATFGEKAVHELRLEEEIGMMTKVKLWLQQLRYPDQFIIALTIPVNIFGKKEKNA